MPRPGTAPGSGGCSSAGGKPRSPHSRGDHFGHRTAGFGAAQPSASPSGNLLLPPWAANPGERQRSARCSGRPRLRDGRTDRQTCGPGTSHRRNSPVSSNGDVPTLTDKVAAAFRHLSALRRRKKTLIFAVTMAETPGGSDIAAKC